MASIIPGFEYDIFISYRQKDNRSDLWVTNFVQALKEELGATFKEEISLYFDSNPHEGLLETHDVDASLKEKIKCIVFIPIVSLTYCDPNSFAWRKEFLPFVDFAKSDQHGLEIKLANGNVAKRVLPIRIHEIDDHDQRLFEEVIGGAMRPVDFIFRSMGVNRPLLPTDKPERSITNISYRDQLNKVANAVREIITAMRNPHQDRLNLTSVNSGVPKKRPATARTWTIILLSILILASILIYYYNQRNSPDKNKTYRVAVLAFKDLSPDEDHDWFGEGIADDIRDRLIQQPGLAVAARTSSMYFKEHPATAAEIGKELNVDYILEGSVRKEGENIKVTVHLTRATDGFHEWSETYNRANKEIFAIQNSISNEVEQKLLSQIYDLERRVRTSTPEAYDYFLKGRNAHRKAMNEGNSEKGINRSIDFLKQSVSIDPLFAPALAEWGNALDTKSNFVRDEVEKNNIWRARDSLIQKAIQIDPELTAALIGKYWSFMKREDPNIDSAYYYLKRAYTKAPQDPVLIGQIGSFLIMIGLPDHGLKFIKRELERDPLNIVKKRIRGLTNLYLGRLDLAYSDFKVLSEMNPNSINDQFSLYIYYLLIKNIESATQQLEKLRKLDPEHTPNLENWLLAVQGKEYRQQSLDDNLFTLIFLNKQDELLNLTNEFCTTPIAIRSQTSLNALFSWEGLDKSPFFKSVRSKPDFIEIQNQVYERYMSRVRKYGDFVSPDNF